MDVHNSFVGDSWKLEVTQISSNRWMDKQIVLYAYNTTQKKKATTDLYNMDQYQKVYTEQNKEDTKGYIMYDSIYKKL